MQCYVQIMFSLCNILPHCPCFCGKFLLKTRTRPRYMRRLRRGAGLADRYIPGVAPPVLRNRARIPAPQLRPLTYFAASPPSAPH